MFLCLQKLNVEKRFDLSNHWMRRSFKKLCLEQLDRVQYETTNELVSYLTYPQSSPYTYIICQSPLWITKIPKFST